MQRGLKIDQDNKRLFVTLYKTRVMAASGGVLHLNTGGWETMSTQKAMNHGLRLAGLNHRYWVTRIKGDVVLAIKHSNGIALRPFTSNQLTIKTHVAITPLD